MSEPRKFVNPKFPFMIHGGDWDPDQWLHMPGIIEEDFRLIIWIVSCILFVNPLQVSPVSLIERVCSFAGIFL